MGKEFLDDDKIDDKIDDKFDIEQNEIDVYAEMAGKAGYEDLKKEFIRLRKRENKHSIIFGLSTLILFVLVVVTLVLTIVRIQYTKTVQQSIAEMNEQASAEITDFDGVIAKLEKLKSYIASNFLFEDEIDVSKIGDSLYHALLSSLDDPYTQYYNEEEYKALTDSSGATFSGIGAGVELDEETKYVKLVRIYDKSGALEAGLLEGDMITAIEGQSVVGQELTELTKKTKGEENTIVNLTIYRPSTGESFDVAVTRKKVDMITCSGVILEDNVGYIVITQFGSDTANQFKKIFNELKEEGMEGVIIDVRSNPGGQLTTVNAILDFLLPEGIIVYTEDKNGNRTDYKSDADCQNIPMAVLINKSSASASEIFAGALKDYKWATIIGVTSYGKGIVQTIHNVGDNTAIKMTVARYFTPSGVCIHGIGIAPDIELEYEVNDEDDTWKADNQALKAYEVVKGKIG